MTVASMSISVHCRAPSLDGENYDSVYTAMNIVIRDRQNALTVICTHSVQLVKLFIIDID